MTNDRTEEKKEADRQAWKVRALDHIETMQRGFVVYDYDVGCDRFSMFFGIDRFPVLINPETNEPFEDDRFGTYSRVFLDGQPIRGIRFDDWMQYMKNWYWPRQKSMKTQAAT